MQMQVIVSACFSLYTYERYSGAPQPAISSTQQNSHFNLNYRYLQPQQTATSIATRSPFHHQSNAISLNNRPYSPQMFINRQILTTLFICSQTQNKRAKQDLTSHSRPSYFIISPKRVLFRYAFLLFNHANAPLKHQESNKTPISFSSKYIDQSFYIDASPPCLCVVPFSNRYTSPQEPHHF